MPNDGIDKTFQAFSVLLRKFSWEYICVLVKLCGQSLRKEATGVFLEEGFFWITQLNS